MASDTIAILDFGSQTSQLIARKVREAQVYCELISYDTPAEQVAALEPAGFILSGGPASIYEDGAPHVPDYVLESGRPILGICYGMQALTDALGGTVSASTDREYGATEIEVEESGALLHSGPQQVWMSHGDHVEKLPPGFRSVAFSDNSPNAAIEHEGAKIYGLQFHPEVRHTPGGSEILRSFAVDICGAQTDWTPATDIPAIEESIRTRVGDGRVLAAVSGGVDSAVAAVLAARALGNQLDSVFVDTGLLRANERAYVEGALGPLLGGRLKVIDSSAEFLSNLAGVYDPEQKRRIVGELFIRTFERVAEHLGRPRFLVQGTIYPDVVESRGPERTAAARIKTHHNVGGLPPEMQFELIEPLRFFFKDEVRSVGRALGLPESLLLRQPFPGPGLAVRCLGEVSQDRVLRLRKADEILLDELSAADSLIEDPAQAFAVLLPIRSVGVMGDQRTYGETIVLRAVTTEDFMTADWARLPHELLARVSSRIVNEVTDVNRVTYDITTKPPGTIEWE